MTTDHDQNPGSGGAGGAEDPTGSDPIDSMTDVGELRGAAKLIVNGLPKEGRDAAQAELDAADTAEKLQAFGKKYRSIGRRVTKKEETPPAPAAPADGAKPLTQEDLFRSNRKRAKQMAENDPKYKDIADNWDELRNLVVSRNGEDTPEDILMDMGEALAVFKHRKGSSGEGNAAADISADAGSRGHGSRQPTTHQEGKDDDPRFTRHRRPDNWYPKKDS